MKEFSLGRTFCEWTYFK